MILIVGGAFQGKKAYARQTFSLEETDITDGGSCELEEIFQARALSHFHEYIRRCLEADRDVSTLPEMLGKKNPQVILIANELGSGVVPTEAFDREYRETVGRLCCALAKEAEEVHRVVCGIGRVIKYG
ncbi:MAG: adenosylcobinamide kinase [Lachnospiraceae bacterium]|nr:adenosylcobinamide kinase [Lachnospiraceae bacterium]